MSKERASVWLLCLGIALSLFFWWQPSMTRAISLELCPSCLVQRDIDYVDIDGVSLKMDIYCCQHGNMRKPAVVYVHGGGWYSGDKTCGAGQCDIPALVTRGYLVAAIDYRLAPRFKFPAQIEDVKCAIRFLRANADVYGIDPAHIGIFGDSAGGHLAALAGLTDHEEFTVSGGYPDESDSVQAVVDMFGPTDLTLTYQQNNSMHIEHVFGTIDPFSPLIEKASPVTYVSAGAPPFLILHGDKDNEVLLEQSEILYQRLMAVNDPVSLIVVSNSGHGLEPVGGAITPTRREITQLMVDFFDRYLKLPTSNR